MKAKRPAVALALALSSLIAACGGGGDDSPPSAPRIPSLDLAEFTGTWLPTPDNADCQPNFAYNTSYFGRVRDAVITASGNTLTWSMSVDVYQDNACTVKLGRVREDYSLGAQAAASTGRANVIKGSTVHVGSSSGADGGLGMTLNKVPDGSFLRMQNEKVLIDRDGDRLYITESRRTAVLDSAGYPREINTAYFATR